MKMSLWEFYQKEIIFFEKKTDELLAETVIQESKIEKRRRQQQLQPTEEDIDKLAELIGSTLKAIAIVKTYVNFQILQIQPSDKNNQLFYNRREYEFIKLLMVFLSKVENENKNENENENEIDFTINR